MSKKSLLFLNIIHIPIWIVVFAFTFVLVYITFPPLANSLLILLSIRIAFSLLVEFYFFFYVLIPKYLEKRKYKQFIVYCLILVFMTPLALEITFGHDYRIMLEGYFTTHKYPSMSAYFGVSVVTLFLCGLAILYRFSIDWFKNVEVKRELENKNLLSELKILKSKLNPHFLFNTLNNIDTLIQTSPEKASVTLSKLSDILRYVVYDTENEKVLIQKEIDNLQKYVELEKIRLVNPNSVEFTSNILNETAIPPMLFFPFVENGFKHSNLNNINHKLKISITEDKSKISFSCSNTINKNKQNGLASGMGLELAKKRLDLLFSNTHVLAITKINNEFRVNLDIQID